MIIILLTIFLSLLLAGIFAALFCINYTRHEDCPEKAALLPLVDDALPQPAPKTSSVP